MASNARLPIASHAAFFFQGLCQAFNWKDAFGAFCSSAAIRKAMLMTVILNGGIFLGFLVMMEGLYNSPDHQFFGYSYTVWTGYPMYLVCLIVNARFFQTISKETFRLQTNFNQIDSSSPSRDISLAIYTTLLYTVFAAFVFLVGLVPFIGKTVSFVSSCIIMAYYCFEYKWTYIGWSRDQSMLFIEYHWAYFLGFGLPVAALTFFLSTLHAGAVFALVYPIFIIMASSASPKPSTTVYGEPLFSGGPIYLRPFTLPFHMPLFYAVRQMNNLFISLIRYVGGTKADAILTHKKDIVGKLV